MPESIVYALLVETVENELQQIFRQTFTLYQYQDGCDGVRAYANWWDARCPMPGQPSGDPLGKVQMGVGG